MPGYWAAGELLGEESETRSSGVCEGGGSGERPDCPQTTLSAIITYRRCANSFGAHEETATGAHLAYIIGGASKYLDITKLREQVHIMLSNTS